MKTALITGINGQDGSYLAQHLLKLNYEVHGTVRMDDVLSVNMLDFCNDVTCHYADLRDALSLEKVIRKSHPDEIYNLAGQVFVPTSWQFPSETMDVNVSGLARILTIIEKVNPKAKIYQASSSEMYGNIIGARLTQEPLSLNENAKMIPVSPYGVSKLAAHKLVDVYRRKGMYVCAGILFNHESPRRGTEMVTKKISKHVAGWAANAHDDTLYLGNTAARRDWGFAGDYVEAMHLMLQQPYADDFVIGMGEAHSVHDFLKEAIECADLPDKYLAKVSTNNPEFGRSNELHTLIADAKKARTILKWQPKHSFQDLVLMMVKNDMRLYESDAGRSPLRSA